MTDPHNEPIKRDRLTILRILIGCVCVPLIYGYGTAWWHLLTQASGQYQRFLWPGAGLGLGVILWVFWLRRTSGYRMFWEPFEHELTHAIFAILLFKKMHRFSVTKGEGGFIVHEGNNLAIRLAPYFFPTPVVPALLLKPIIRPELTPAVDALIGFTLFLYLVGTVHELDPRQPDIASTGIVLSVLIIALMNMIFLGFIVTVSGYGFTRAGLFLTEGIINVWQAISFF